jgi:hypothetical protein
LGQQREASQGEVCGNHCTAAYRVYKPAKENGPKEVGKSEGEEQQAGVGSSNTVEAQQDQRGGEKDGVVEEGLRHDKDHSEQGAATVTRFPKHPQTAKWVFGAAKDADATYFLREWAKLDLDFGLDACNGG